MVKIRIAAINWVTSSANGEEFLGNCDFIEINGSIWFYNKVTVIYNKVSFA